MSNLVPSAPGLPALNDALTFEGWGERIRLLAGGGVLLKLELGRTIAWGEKRWGDRYTQALSWTNYSEGSLRNAVYVATNVPEELWSPDLSWTHHALVAPFKDQPWVQAELLQLARECEWSAEMFRDHIKGIRSDPGPTRPVLKLRGNVAGAMTEIVLTRGVPYSSPEEKENFIETATLAFREWLTSRLPEPTEENDA